MSERPHVYVSHRVEVPDRDGEEPNRHRPWITAEVRVHAPARCTRQEVLNALLAASCRAAVDVDRVGEAGAVWPLEGEPCSASAVGASGEGSSAG